MQTPNNPFKQAISKRQAQIGLWMCMANANAAEICAGAGFDWLLIDGEHSPNGLASVQAQAQAIAAYPGCHAIARVPVGHGHVGTANIKQYLDLGIQTILVPMVDTAEQAREIVRAMRYPQDDGKGGIRGMGGARASRWGRYPHYAKEANEQVCLLVQAESGQALENLDAIAAVEGVDGVFFGPADLSASMGHVGNATHPEVQAAIENGVRRVLAAGKAPGILTLDDKLSQHYLDLGTVFVAVGVDTTLLVRGTSALTAKFKSARLPAKESSTY